MQQPFEPTSPPGDSDTLNLLIEKSLGGALSAAEQIQLGELLASAPNLAEHLAQAQREDTAMQAAVMRVIDGFDFERARRAITHKIRMQRGIMIGILGMLLLGVPVWIAAHRLYTGHWPSAALIVLLSLAMILGNAFTWAFMGPRRGLRRDLAEGGDALRSAYERQLLEIPRHVKMMRFASVVLPLCGMLLLIEAIVQANVLTAIAAIALFGLSVVAHRQASRIKGELSGTIGPTAPGREQKP